MRLFPTLKRRFGDVFPEKAADRLAIAVAGALGLVTALTLLVIQRADPERHRALAGVVVEGGLQRREARETTWETLREGDPVYFGDTWHALKSRPAAVLLKNGRRIDLDGGAIVRLDGFTDHGAEVSIYAGRLRRTAGLLVHDKERVQVAPAPKGVYLGIPQLVIRK